MACMTVLGKKDCAELGIVTPHEHIFIDMSVFFHPPEEVGNKQMAYGPVTIEKLGVLKRNPFAVLDNVMMTDYATQLEEVKQFAYAGGRTVVDASNRGLGRNPELLRRISLDTGMHVICGAGFYVEGAQSPAVLAMSTEDMENEIVREVEVGIGHSGIRAGIIGEIGISHEMFPFEKKSLVAACRAQRRTGAPLMVHINPWCTQGLQAMDIIREHGIDPTRVVICHSDVENREDYIFRLLDMGVYVEFDNWGKEMATDPWDIAPGNGPFVSDKERCLLAKKILDAGYGKQLLFSCDVCLKSLLHAYGGWGYDHVLTHIVPALQVMGVTDDQFQDIFVNNPARWLDFC